MTKMTWHPKKEEREIVFLYHKFFNRGDRLRKGNAMPGIEDMASKLESFTYDVVDRESCRQDLLGKVRTSIPRTKNENFSHLISMGYQ